MDQVRCEDVVQRDDIAADDAGIRSKNSCGIDGIAAGDGATNGEFVGEREGDCITGAKRCRIPARACKGIRTISLIDDSISCGNIGDIRRCSHQ